MYYNKITHYYRDLWYWRTLVTQKIIYNRFSLFTSIGYELDRKERRYNPVEDTIHRRLLKVNHLRRVVTILSTVEKKA